MTVFILGTVWLAVVLGGLALSVKARRRPGDAWANLPDPRPVVSGTGQILFTESEGDALRMDCVLIGDDAQGAAPGSLMTVRLFPPPVPAAVTPFDAILAEWARDVRVVDLELRPAPDGWRLRLDDGLSRLSLEISQPTTVG